MLYNVTFCTKDWDLTTTVDIKSIDEQNIIDAAADKVFRTARIDIESHRMFEITVEPVGGED